MSCFHHTIIKMGKNISCMVYSAVYNAINRKIILLKAKNCYSYSKAALLYGASPSPWHGTKTDFMYEKSNLKRI